MSIIQEASLPLRQGAADKEDETKIRWHAPKILELASFLTMSGSINQLFENTTGIPVTESGTS